MDARSRQVQFKVWDKNKVLAIDETFNPADLLKLTADIVVPVNSEQLVPWVEALDEPAGVLKATGYSQVC